MSAPAVDARERFLRAIAERIGEERIEEIHLFPPLRQGGRESGVAVVAARGEAEYVQGELPPPVGEAASDEGRATGENDSDERRAASDEGGATGENDSDERRATSDEGGEAGKGTGVSARGGASGAAGEGDGAPPRSHDTATSQEVADPSSATPIDSPPPAPPSPTRELAGDDELPAAGDQSVLTSHAPRPSPHVPSGHEADAAPELAPPAPPGDEGVDPDLADAPSSPVAPRSSLHKSIVYRALYRWTRKGPDRGKWEIEITAEADAPLQAVSDVVRGVHRRAGEDAEPERLGPDELKVALSDTPWTVAATT